MSSSPSESPQDGSDKAKKGYKPRTAEMFNREKHILGHGTYGDVFLATDPLGNRVALKKIKMVKEKEGFPITAIREIKLLKEMSHPCIVKLQDVVPASVSHRSSVFMVFEYLDHDLTGLLDEETILLSPPQIKYYMQKILEALSYCHNNRVIHRDIKGANVLIGNSGDVKLADFGLARAEMDGKDYTNRVVTLWYRPPELLLGSTEYTSKADMWSVGCLFHELLLRGESLFPGHSELELLNRIYKLCGSPSEEVWPGVSSLPWFERFKPKDKVFPRVFKQEISKRPEISPAAVDLLDRLLTLDPTRRISADEALDHEFFSREMPPPMRKEDHPAYTGNFHEYATKQKNRQKRRDSKRNKGTVMPSDVVTVHDEAAREDLANETVESPSAKRARVSVSHGGPGAQAQMPPPEVPAAASQQSPVHVAYAVQQYAGPDGAAVAYGYAQGPPAPPSQPVALHYGYAQVQPMQMGHAQPHGHGHFATPVMAMPQYRPMMQHTPQHVLAHAAQHMPPHAHAHQVAHGHAEMMHYSHQAPGGQDAHGPPAGRGHFSSVPPHAHGQYVHGPPQHRAGPGAGAGAGRRY